MIDCPFDVDAVVDYALGEMPETGIGGFEEHLFSCPRCAHRLDAIDVVRQLVSNSVLEAAIGGSVTEALLTRARHDGLTLREYRIAEGATVPCSAGPEDLVVVRLAADLEQIDNLRLRATMEDLEKGTSAQLPARDVIFDRDAAEVVLVFPGDVVRAYPRSRWTLHLLGETATGPAELGPFVMDHTP